MRITAHVRDGRLVVDEPADLPDGTEVQMLPPDPGDWLGKADRPALHKALSEPEADVAAGGLMDAGEILREIKPR